MLITTGLAWPAMQQQNRTGNDQPQTQAATFQPVTASHKPDARQANQQGSSQQGTEGDHKEAFAKLMLMLQNPDAHARRQTSVGEQGASSALQEFRDYMAKSPAEKIKEKLLQELGLTQDEYDALPPERKMKVDELIARRIQEDVQMKTQARLEQQAQADGKIAGMRDDDKPKATAL
ncbi:hypothetical protein [Pseudomonas sp. microsymbiont 2]